MSALQSSIDKGKRKSSKERAERFIWSEGDIEFDKPLSKEELAELKKPKSEPKKKPTEN